MLVRSYLQHDQTPLTELTIETFRPFFEESFRPAVGDLIFDIQHGNWRGDYHELVAELHNPQQHKYVAIAEIDGDIAGYTGWQADPARRHGRISILAVASAHRQTHVGTALCEHAFAGMRTLGAEMVEIGTGGDAFHGPARALYESLGCVKVPGAVYFRQL